MSYKCDKYKCQKISRTMWMLRFHQFKHLKYKLEGYVPYHHVVTKTRKFGHSEKTPLKVVSIIQSKHPVIVSLLETRKFGHSVLTPSKVSITQSKHPVIASHLPDTAQDYLLKCAKFKRQAKKERHLRVHTGIKQFHCKTCEKSFADQSTLRRHLGTHNPGNNSHKCEICGCGRLCQSKSHLKLHIRTHDSENNKYKCEICGKLCQSQWHVVNNHKHKRNSASNSDKEYRDDKKKAHPNNSHGKSKDVQCPICHATFKGKLKRHLRTHDPENNKYKCQICGKLCQSKWHVNNHKHKRNSPFSGDLSCDSIRNRKKMQCPTCPVILQSEASLKRHMLLHDPGNNRYKCEICGKLCGSRWLVNDHKRVHLVGCKRSEDVQCDICGKSFTHRKNLKVHHKKHAILRDSESNKYKYKCEFCGKLCGSSHHLEDHKHVHLQ